MRQGSLRIDDPVRVRTGPFESFRGTVTEIDDATRRVRVAVEIYGRQTPVELELDQVEKL
jgi:transcriptional antiterminator NusG